MGLSREGELKPAYETKTGMPTSHQEKYLRATTTLTLMMLTGVSLVITARLLWLAGNDMIDSYPFMFPDSFDWITNALYYIEIYKYHLTPTFPTIRAPFFPLLIALTYLIGLSNMVIVIIQFASWGIILYTLKCARLLQIRDAFLVPLLLFLGAHYSFNMFRTYILADMVCIFLITVSIYYYLIYLRGNRRRSLLSASLLSSIAGITQVFGLFPALAFSGLQLFYAVMTRDLKSFQCAVLNLVLPGAAQVSWMLYKFIHFGDPTATQVNHFSLLKFSFANFHYYSHVWLIFFFPLICTGMILLPFYKLEIRSYRSFLNLEVVFLAVVNLLFVLSIFFYQWQESRFTTYFLSTAAIFGYLVLHQATKKIPTFAFLLVSFLNIFLAAVPTNDLMRPKFYSYIENVFKLESILHRNFLAQLFAADQVHRLSNIDCIEKRSGADLQVKEGCDHYIYNNLIRYLHYRDTIRR